MNSHSKKKILVITPRFPYPVIGGDKLRIYELCRELSKFYNVTLLSLCDSKDELSLDIPNDNVFSEIHRVFLPKWKSYLNCLFALFSSRPLQVAYYRSSAFRRKLKYLIDEYDLVIPHLIRMADYVKNYKQPKIIEMTDAISMNYQRIRDIDNNSGFKGIIYKLEQNRLNKYEKEITKYFDASVFVSKYDKSYLFNQCSFEYKKALVCSNGVELSKYPYQFSHGTKKLIFIGNLSSIQNFDAAYWFASEVMPKLRQNDAYEFHVIGKIPKESAKKLQNLRGVYVTGAVDVISEHTQGALAGICSVRLAAGVQNKVLEYMAMGIPTISSSTGLEGFEAKENQDILIADTVEDYVEHIENLSKDKKLASDISKNALEYVNRNHSWENKLSPLISTINNLLK